MILAELTGRELGAREMAAVHERRHGRSALDVGGAEAVLAHFVPVPTRAERVPSERQPQTRMLSPSASKLETELVSRRGKLARLAVEREPIGAEKTNLRLLGESTKRRVLDAARQEQRVGVDADQDVELKSKWVRA